MNIYIYSDESGVLDKTHNDYFVFAGLIFFNKEDKDICSRKYQAAEKAISKRYPKNIELKGSLILNKDKGKLFRSLNNYIKFAVVIEEKELLDSIFNSKKSKQRYLDYAFKICLKKTFQQLHHDGLLDFKEVKNIYIYADEHTTATDGKYELTEALLQEFKFGTHNWNYRVFFPPIFPNLNSLAVKYCNSKTNTLIRSADIIANRIYFYANNGKSISEINNLYCLKLP